MKPLADLRENKLLIPVNFFQNADFLWWQAGAHCLFFRDNLMILRPDWKSEPNLQQARP